MYSVLEGLMKCLVISAHSIITTDKLDLIKTKKHGGMFHL